MEANHEDSEGNPGPRKQRTVLNVVGSQDLSEPTVRNLLYRRARNPRTARNLVCDLPDSSDSTVRNLLYHRARNPQTAQNVSRDLPDSSDPTVRNLLCRRTQSWPNARRGIVSCALCHGRTTA